MATVWIQCEAVAWLSCTSTTRAVETTVIGNPADGYQPLYDQAALDAAVAVEREACAKLCEENRAGLEFADGAVKHILFTFHKELVGSHDGRTYAAAIRARGEQAKEK